MTWRLLPVTTLTLRQFAGGRTARLVFLLSLIPALFAAIYVVRPWDVAAEEFLVELFREMIVPTLLPIVVLLPATAAFGDELEDRTLPYLLMKPVTRVRLVLGKYAAILLVTVPALVIGLVVTTLVAGGGSGVAVLLPTLRAMIAAAALAVVLLSAVFLLVSLLIPRALLAGMIYIFAWESLLGRFLPGVRAISSREATLRVFDGLRADDIAQAISSAQTMIVVVVVCLVLAAWRLSRTEID